MSDTTIERNLESNDRNTAIEDQDKEAQRKYANIPIKRPQQRLQKKKKVFDSGDYETERQKKLSNSSNSNNS